MEAPYCPPVSSIILCLLIGMEDEDVGIRQEAADGLRELSPIDFATAHDELTAIGSPNAKIVSELVEELETN